VIRVTRVLAVAFAALAVTCGSNAASPASPDPINPSPSAPAQGCAQTSVGLTPLTDLVGGAYQGQPGGLYPGTRNDPPAGHLAAGLQRARAIEPLDGDGRPSASGRYAFVSIGMSNTTQEFGTFVPLANADPLKDPRLSIVDGAQGGMTAADWANPACSCWTELERRLRQVNLTAAQIATAWVKLADRQPSSGWPAYATTLRDETIVVLQHLKSRFANLQIAYLSSRIYAGYATTTLNPEPYAYQSGFSMRWVIEDQINGSAQLVFDGPASRAPWIAWGPYLWADGLRTRSDGLFWACSDFNTDGTHPAAAGRQKVADLLIDFVHSDPTAREWYAR
jgi:lysophospholipase L1-like esterase